MRSIIGIGLAQGKVISSGVFGVKTSRVFLDERVICDHTGKW
jgi:hypothetical protein